MRNTFKHFSAIGSKTLALSLSPKILKSLKITTRTRLNVSWLNGSLVVTPVRRWSAADKAIYAEAMLARKQLTAKERRLYGYPRNK
jgi:antitoxin component of MazEF toxin-antitoxin module